MFVLIKILRYMQLNAVCFVLLLHRKFVINKNLPIGLEAKSNLWGNCGVIVYTLFVALCT